MLKFRVERSAFLDGFGFYISKKSWNIIGNKKMWYGPSFVIHSYNKMFRLSWVIKEYND